MAVQDPTTVLKSKCLCDYQMDSDYFQQNTITSEHLNEMSRMHFARGLHKLTKILGCSDNCKPVHILSKSDLIEEAPYDAGELS